MPELPEVETIRRGIEPLLVNQKIANVHIYNHRLRWPIPTDLPNKLKNATVKEITRRGKYLLLTTTNGTLLIHLGMTGQLLILNKKSSPAKHDHFDLILKNHKCLRYNDQRKFGTILWTQNPENHKLLSKLGPEPLSKDFNCKYLYQKSINRKTPIKSFIMDSSIVVGVGNIYANEALFAAGINPIQPAGKIKPKPYEVLVTNIKKILKEAIAQGGTTIRNYIASDGSKGKFIQSLKVYGKENHPCPKCRSLIQKVPIGQRSSFYCPKCQPIVSRFSPPLA